MFCNQEKKKLDEQPQNTYYEWIITIAIMEYKEDTK